MPGSLVLYGLRSEVQGSAVFLRKVLGFLGSVDISRFFYRPLTDGDVLAVYAAQSVPIDLVERDGAASAGRRVNLDREPNQRNLNGS
jgi:hypothetical protein